MTALEELYEVGGDVLPTETNVEILLLSLLDPALACGDPLLVSVDEKGEIEGFLLWPIVRDGIAYAGGKRALGVMTWVRPDLRRKGLATHLRERAREILEEQFIDEVVGVVLPENAAGLASLSTVKHEQRGVVIHSRI